MEKQKVATVHVDENGNVYELKKPIYKKPLFWSTIVFGTLAFICFAIMIIVAYVATNQMNEVNGALEKYGIYYDIKDGGIYNVGSSESSTEKTSQSSLATETSLNDESIDISDPLAWIKGFKMISDEKELSADDVFTIKLTYIATLEDFLVSKENPSEQEKRWVENGKTMMDEVANIYRNAEHYDRKLTDTEKSIVYNDVSNMLKIIEDLKK